MIEKYEDVLLRLFEINDIKKKVEWINCPNNNKYLHYDLPLTEEGTLKWFKNRSDNRLDCVIEYNNLPVGIIGLLNIDMHNKKAEYYITIGETKLKKCGIATKATKALLKYGFQVLELNKIYLNVDEDNIAARNLYEKCGFVCEGTFKKDLLVNKVWINRMRYAVFARNNSLGVE